MVTRILMQVFYVIGALLLPFCLLGGVAMFLHKEIGIVNVFGFLFIIGTICYGYFLIKTWREDTSLVTEVTDGLEKMGNGLGKATVLIKDKADEWARNAEEARQLSKRKLQFVQSISSHCQHAPVQATVRGGSGWELKQSELLLLSCRESALHLHNVETEKEVIIPFSKLTAIDVSGPGKETGNAGVIGGGFGLEGAAKGMLIATAVNILTTHSSTNTLLRLAANNAEVLLHTSAIEPAALRAILSPAFVQMEAAKRSVAIPASNIAFGSEMEKLFELFKAGAITESEFSTAKGQLLGGKIMPAASATDALPETIKR